MLVKAIPDYFDSRISAELLRRIEAGEVLSEVISDAWHRLYLFSYRSIELRQLLVSITDLVLLALGFRLSQVLVGASVNIAIHEHKKRKIKVKALLRPILLVPKSLHPVKLAAL